MKLKSLTIAACFTLTLALSSSLSGQSTSSVAQTPPMGWNSWNHFAEKVTDGDVRAAADALVSSGMRDAGYVYVNIDDTWEGKRDANGVIQTNEKFPDMKALADYVHSKKLKLGIYSSPGPKTCAGYEGSYNHEEQDAKSYAAWGIDYLKYDLCSFIDVMKQQAPSDNTKQYAMMREAYAKMHRALAATGRPILYSLCQYGWDNVWKWGPSVGGNAWRTTGDISDNYDRMSVIGFAQAGLAKYAAPGHWNDPDMLEVGNGHMSRDQYVTHMTLWAILAAPLLAGNDLSKMSAETHDILTNRDVIAVDQDALGKQGDRVWAEGPYEIWMKPLSGGAKAVALFNRGEREAEVTLHLDTVGVKSAQGRDVWAGKDLGKLTGSYETTVPAMGAVLLILR
jgi:alpha-galactosidase